MIQQSHIINPLLTSFARVNFRVSGRVIWGELAFSKNDVQIIEKTLMVAVRGPITIFNVIFCFLFF